MLALPLEPLGWPDARRGRPGRRRRRGHRLRPENLKPRASPIRAAEGRLDAVPAQGLDPSWFLGRSERPGAADQRVVISV